MICTCGHDEATHRPVFGDPERLSGCICECLKFTPMSLDWLADQSDWARVSRSVMSALRVVVMPTGGALYGVFVMAPTGLSDVAQVGPDLPEHDAVAFAVELHALTERWTG